MLTNKLKDICEIFSNVIKENKIRPITDFVEIYSKDGIAHLGMTDNRTTITATLENENDIDSAVLSLRDLYKLVKLIPTEYVILTHKDNYVEVKTSGKYKLPIQVDEMGNDISLCLDMPKMGTIVEYNSSDFKTILVRNKVGLYTGDSHNEFKLYYNTGNKLITTDSIVVACTKNLSLPLKNIQAFVVEQLSNFNDTLKFSEVDDGYRISCNNSEVYMVNKLYEEFPIEMVQPFVEEDSFSEMFPIKVDVEKSVLVNSIKRQDIFKSVYDMPTVIFETGENLLLKNKKETVEDNLVPLNTNEIMQVEVQTKVILEVLKNMEKELTLWLGKQAICLQDEVGFYIIAVVEGR